MHVLSRGLFKRVQTYSRCICYVRNVQRQYLTSRSAIGEHITKLNDETLTGRLLTYLDSDKSRKTETKKITKTFCDLTTSYETELKALDTKEVISSFTLLSNNDHVAGRYKILKFINVLDIEFCRRLSYLERKDKLKILHAYMDVIPNRIVQYRYYKAAVEEIFNELEMLDKNDLIQLIFYIGLQKKNAKSQYMLRKCMQLLDQMFIHNLTTEELCIICNSTFKTSTKINNKLFLNKVTNHLNDNLCLLKDPALFITLIKTIRHNRYQSEDLLATIRCTVFFNKTVKYYSFPALCHILALYSDYLYYDESLIKVFTETCIEQLKDNDYILKRAHMTEQPRVKDIKRLLWCLSYLSYKNLKESDVRNVIIPNILRRLKAGEFKNDFISLIDIMLYLWMLNYHAYDLVPYALKEENMQSVRASTSAVKNRLNLLLTCIYFEDRRLYREIKMYPLENTKYDIMLQLKKRPLLQKVLDNLKTLVTQSNINKYEAGCQVPYLNIVGITGYQKSIYKTVHIEVLDEHTSMKNVEDTPTGLMDLKLRILEGFQEGLIVIRATEVESMTDVQLHTFLQEELDLVC